MTFRVFSDKDRPVHMGKYPLERLVRTEEMPDLSQAPAFKPLSFRRPDAPQSIVNAMTDYQAMLDAIRSGGVNRGRAGCPSDIEERANHLKGFGYFSDATMVGICKLPKSSLLKEPIRNPDIDQLVEDLKTKQTKTLSSGVDLVMADLRETVNAPQTSIDAHTHAIVYLFEYPRDPAEDETGCEWLQEAQAARAALRASETACVIAQYIRLLGYDARSHTGTTSDIDLNKLTVAAGLATVENGALTSPYIGDRFGGAVVTTNFQLAIDKPLVPLSEQPRGKTHGLAWQLGKGFAKNALNHVPYGKRRFVDGAYPFERLKRVEKTTTFIDETRVARVPKRTDMFARSLFGDMGKTN